MKNLFEIVMEREIAYEEEEALFNTLTNIQTRIAANSANHITNSVALDCMYEKYHALHSIAMLKYSKAVTEETNFKKYKHLKTKRFYTLEGNGYDLYSYKLYSDDKYMLTLAPVNADGHSSVTDVGAMSMYDLSYNDYAYIICACTCYKASEEDLTDLGFISEIEELCL